MFVQGTARFAAACALAVALAPGVAFFLPAWAEAAQDTGSATSADTATGAETADDASSAAAAKAARAELDALAASHKSVLANGNYTFSNDGKIIGVKDAASSNGAELQLGVNRGGSHQVWKVTHDSKGYVTLANYRSGKVATAQDGAAKNGVVVVQSANTGSYAQKWIAAKSGSRVYFISALDKSLYLKIDGTQLKLGTSKNTWGATSISSARVYLNNLAHENASEVKAGTYFIVLAKKSSRALNVKRGSKAAKTGIALYAKAPGNSAQAWKVSHDTMGYLTIKNVRSGKALAISGASTKSGTKVLQVKKSSSRAQRWIAVKSGEGYELVSALDKDIVLGVPGGKSTLGTAAKSYKRSSSSARKWKFSTYKAFSGTKKKMMNKAERYATGTKYLILVNCKAHRVGIYKGGKGTRVCVKYWKCTNGAPWSPTVKGTFHVGSRGLAFGGGYTCWYYTQFYGNYLFHSVLYKPGSKTRFVDGRLGIAASHGCVRLALGNAKWIYRHIPSGTKVVAY